MIDLHTHTTASDGALSPADLLRRAAEKGVDRLAITDHDTMAAYAQLQPPAGVALIGGIELSTTWQKAGLHVLGLNVRVGSGAMAEAVRFQGQARSERAVRIAEKLKPICGEDPFPAVRKLATGPWVGRPHFARYLVERRIVADEAEAFRRYLGAGKAGDVRQHWAPLAQVIQWIQDAGGIAVIAHPAKYGFTNARLRRMIAEFRALGGGGMEVVSGQQTEDLTRYLGKLCRDAKMLASCGSDFHRPDVPWSELGRFPTLPEGVTPVWDQW